VLENACELVPGDLEPRLALAEACLLINNLEQATRYADQALQLAPEQTAPRMILADIALRSGDLPLARMHAEAILRKEPENPAALHILARALDGLGCSKEALEIVEKAIPVAPDPLPFLLEKARLLGCQEGKSASLAALQQLADQYPDEATVLAPFASELARAGLNAEAIRAAQRALRSGRADLSPEDQAALHFLLGRLLRQTGQLDQAIHQLSEATRLDSSDIEPYLELGEALQERRQYSLAMESYRKAISIAPHDPRPFLQAGITLKASRDYQGAERMFRRAASGT
jgi:Flp pilus assembly protein TadD